METATVSPSDFDVLFEKGSGQIGWVAIAYRGWIIEFAITTYFPEDDTFHTLDLTTSSHAIGLTIKQFADRYPTYRPNEFRALTYFFSREPQLETYLASRLNVMKQISADKHIPAKLIRRLMEAK